MRSKVKQYIFQTGHGKGLAKAELKAVYGEEAIGDEVEDGFVVDGTLSKLSNRIMENPGQELNRLGGVIRISEVLQSGPARMPLNFEEWVSRTLKENFHDYKGKMRFGLNMHPKNEKILKKILNASKKSGKVLGNLRYVNKNFQNLSSVQAWHEDLLNKGALELNLFQSESKWYLSRTLAIQNFEWYSKRDYDRPKKNARNGMLPPKLAQMLINLAQPEPGATVFDPFCGSGTVIQEALLMGYAAWGSDLEAEFVEDTKQNLKWLVEQSEFRRMAGEDKPRFEVKLGNALELTTKDLPPDSFVIVSETWLGPRLTKLPSPAELQKIQEEVENLLETFLKNLKSIADRSVTLVLAAPFHKEKNDRLFLPHLPEMFARHAKIIPLSERERPSLFYERKDQTVGREIWKLVVNSKHH